MDEIKEQIQAAKDRAIATGNNKALMHIELAEAFFDSAMIVANLIRDKNFHLIEVEAVLFRSKVKAIRNNYVNNLPNGGFVDGE